MTNGGENSGSRAVLKRTDLPLFVLAAMSVAYFVFWGCFPFFQTPQCMADLREGQALPDLVFESAAPIERNFELEASTVN